MQGADDPGAGGTHVDYLGHAGMVFSHRGTSLAIDPWFFPAFFESWFPRPDNRDLLAGFIARPLDWLYVSHQHEDHLDRSLLGKLDRAIPVLCPAFPSRGLERALSALGFRNLVVLGHRESRVLAPGLAVTMYLDGSHKEDSALLVEAEGFRFLDGNDCRVPLHELPSGVDLFAAQFSGAMWYPNAYSYGPEAMAAKVARVREDLLETLVSQCRATGARHYLPIAGPPAFLDPALERFTDRAATIFPLWEDVAPRFAAKHATTRPIPIAPGDRVIVDGNIPRVLPRAAPQPDAAGYRERRRGEWSAFSARPAAAPSRDELERYFAALHERNGALVASLASTIRISSGGKAFTVRVGGDPPRVSEVDAGAAATYRFTMPAAVLRAIVDGNAGWEEALLSMRVALSRDPDVFDSRLFGLLRYGHAPAQTERMIRETEGGGTIEIGGYRIARRCPHAGEDLSRATVTDGILECPRHHWKWRLETGECVDGGALRLQVERVRS